MPASPARQPRGSADGGRFATTTLAETQVSLVDPDDPTPVSDEHGPVVADHRDTRAFVIARAHLGRSLACASLSMADLSRTDLPGVDLSQADLYATDLSGAHMPGANLYAADARRADLRGTRLTGANLCSADLTGARVDSATDLNGVTYDRRTRWPRAMVLPSSAQAVEHSTPGPDEQPIAPAAHR